MRALASWLWMTGVHGTRWLRDPSEPRAPLGDKLWAGLGAWALFGLPVIITAALGVWIIWLFVRIFFVGVALVLMAAIEIEGLMRRRRAR